MPTKPSAESLADMIVATRDGQEKIVERLDHLDFMFLKAFPGGDADGHRRYHEAVIERTAEIRRLRIAIQEKTLEACVWALIAGLAILIWSGIKAMLISLGK